MNATQKHAIMVLVDSVVAQLDAIRSLVAASTGGDEPAHRSHRSKPHTSIDGGVLTDEEEEAAAELLRIPQLSAEQLQAHQKAMDDLLHSAMRGATDESRGAEPGA